MNAHRPTNLPSLMKVIEWSSMYSGRMSADEYSHMPFLVVVCKLDKLEHQMFYMNLGVVRSRQRITCTLRTCWIWHARPWPIWSRARPLRRFAKPSTSRMTSHQRRKRKYDGRISGPLSKSFFLQIKSLQPNTVSWTKWLLFCLNIISEWL